MSQGFRSSTPVLRQAAGTRPGRRLGRAMEEIPVPTGQDGAMEDTPTRRLPLVAELVGFAGLLTIDEVMAGRLGLSQAGRPLSTAVVLAILTLTLLRRRLPPPPGPFAPGGPAP